MAHVTTTALSDSEHERLAKYYINVEKYGVKFLRTNPGNCTLPIVYEKYKEQLFNWQVRPDDVYVLGFMKTGTTWAHEMVWCIKNYVDLDKAKSIPLFERCPFYDAPLFSKMLEGIQKQTDGTAQCLGPLIRGFESSFENAKQMKSQRILKSHLPLCLLPVDLLDKSKAVFCLRNPKDTIVSFYHYEKLVKMHNFSGDFETYFDLFMDNLVVYSPYWELVLNAWKLKDHPNLCLLFYEDMKKDLKGNIRRLASFLQKDLTDNQIQDLVEHLSFETMKASPAVNNEALRKIYCTDPDAPGSFFRKGEVGDWKNYFTDEMNKRVDERITKYFRGTGLEFTYE